MYTTTIVILLAIFGTIASGERVEQLGNDLAASASGVDVEGISFLLDDIVLTEGILFAYSAFFRKDTPVRFQIWRPDSQPEEKLFKLVGETRVIPSVVNQREDVYIESKLTEKCVRVHTGDRLGIFFEEAPGAVAYTFDPKQPMALGHYRDNGTDLVPMNTTVKFDSLTFPYDFSMAAYIDTDSSLYDADSQVVECPKGLLIPSYEMITLPQTTAVPVTGKPGATGATGPAGSAGQNGLDGFTGATGPMGSMGATGFTGAAGPVGATGVTGEMGGDGPMGPAGATGPQGPKGDKGERGPVGPPGPPGSKTGDGFNTVSASSSKDDNSMLNLILMAWLALVTIVLIILIIVVIIMRRRESKYPKESLPEAGPEFKPSWQEVLKDESETSWQDTLKEDIETNYPADTLTSSPKAKHESANVPEYAFRPNSQHVPTFTFESETGSIHSESAPSTTGSIAKSDTPLTDS